MDWTESFKVRILRASLIAQLVKNLLAVQETGVQFLGQEDPLEKEMATHCNIFAGEPHRQRSLAGYSPWDSKGQIQLRNYTTTTRWQVTTPGIKNIQCKNT